MTVVEYRPRPQPGSDAARVDKPPTVDQFVDERVFNVTVDVTEQVDFEALIKAVHRDEHLRWCWMTIARNTSNAGARELAMRDLLKDPAVRQAMTMTLVGADAESFGLALDRACTTPPDCAFCDNYAVTREGDHEVCGQHVEPDSLDVYEHNRDH